MLENLFNLVKQQAGDAIINNLGMFANGQANASAPVVQQATGNFMERLQSKFGLNSSQASGIAQSVIPNWASPAFTSTSPYC